MRAAGILALLIVALGLPGTASAAFGGQNGKIAFERFTHDTVTTRHIHTIAPDGSGNTQITSASPSRHPAWSPNGARIAFVRGNSVMTTDQNGGTLQTVFTWSGEVGTLDWSPDGTRLTAELQTCDPEGECRFDIYTVDADGTDLTDITPDLFEERNPTWSPDGTQIAFDTTREGNRDIYAVAVNGSSLTRLSFDPAPDSDPDWSPDGDRIAFVSERLSRQDIFYLEVDGGGEFRFPGTNDNPPDTGPAWSPDGEQIVFSKRGFECNAIWTMNATGGSGATQLTNPQKAPNFLCGGDLEPDWQPLLGSYARPKGASPVYMSLVPAFKPCVTSNRTHGPPLAFPSCNPPMQESDHLTVGTPETNGHPANSIGFLRLVVIPGNPAQFGNQADIRVDFSLTDIRDIATGDTIVSGSEVRVVLGVRITDRYNGLARQYATVTDLEIPVTATCHAGPPPNGGRCFISSLTMNAIVPTAVREGDRATWELAQVKVYDGGADGDADTTEDNTLFAVQGVLVP